MTYKLGKRSLARLAGVHPDLVKVVKRAIEITEVDFTVLEGLRTQKRQRQLVDAGSSWTMKGRHLVGGDGKGHAVDLGAWVSGRVDWSWPLYYKIARAVQLAGRELNVPIRWGGAWDKRLTRMQGKQDVKPYMLSKGYIDARHRAGKEAHPDGPHFELPRTRKYPA